MPPLTRGEAVASLLMARGIDIDAFPADKRLRDVPRDAWFAPAMAAAVRMGVVSPTPNGSVFPHVPVTRSAFVKMATVAFALPLDMPHRYRDVPAESWMKRFAGNARIFALFPRDPDPTLLQPDRAVTRTESAYAIAALRTLQEEMDAREHEAAMGHLQISMVVSARRERLVLEEPPPLETRRTYPPSSRPSGSAGSAPSGPAPVAARTLEQLRGEVLSLVNARRAEAGIAPLADDPLLSGSAQAYARDMAYQNFFSHVSPAGQTLRGRIAAVGYDPRGPEESAVDALVLGENLARGQRTPAEAVEDWMASPAHRAILLSPDYTQTGIGIAAGYWVEHFGGVLHLGSPR